MTTLDPQPPYVWPEPRVLQNLRTYAVVPPYSQVATAARAFYGIVSAITENGVDVLQNWLESNPELEARLIVVVYPTCATRQPVLAQLKHLVAQSNGRLAANVYPLQNVSDRASNVLCFVGRADASLAITTGPSEDLGLHPAYAGQANFVFRADEVLADDFRRYFDWMWGNSRDLANEGVSTIPHLSLPAGSEEGAQIWREYLLNFVPASDASASTMVQVSEDDATSEVAIQTTEGDRSESPTEAIDVPKLDELALRTARLYDKGMLVSIDKLSRIPPLDAPLDPNVFGDPPELQAGNVTRRVRMRVSIIDEQTLKEIEKRRKGIRTLLTKFTFALADNMRWMPNAARELFQSELHRMNTEGRKLISNLMQGDVDGFIESHLPALVDDIKTMHTRLGRSESVTEADIADVVKSLRARLEKAQRANFMPMLSYSAISFAGTDSELDSPWGQAFSLLADVAAFPRKALTNGFFMRGLQVSESELLKAMNVADDALLHQPGALGIKDRCNDDLDLLQRIREAALDSKQRCKLVWRMLDGEDRIAINKELQDIEVQ